MQEEILNCISKRITMHKRLQMLTQNDTSDENIPLIVFSSFFFFLNLKILILRTEVYFWQKK